MKVIIAPEHYELKDDEISVFLAGGITNCPEWQDKVIKELEKDLCHSSLNDKVVIFNPRRKNFPIDDPTASYGQIRWEFDALQRCTIFSMYFSGGESDQPICMYELGRNLTRMMFIDPIFWKNRVVISASQNYKRIKDVLIQVGLAGGHAFNINTEANESVLIRKHAIGIYNSIYKCYRERAKSSEGE